MNNIPQDINLYILQQYDISIYDDVLVLYKLMQINKNFYKIVNIILNNLIEFYKKRESFDILGHKEAIETGDIKIVKYIESRYSIKKYNSYMNYDDCEKVKKFKFIDILRYLNLWDNDTEYQIYLIAIKENKLDYILQNPEMYYDFVPLMAVRYLEPIPNIIMSNNPEIFDLFLYHVDLINNYTLEYAILNNCEKSVDYIIKKDPSLKPNKSLSNLYMFLKFYNSVNYSPNEEDLIEALFNDINIFDFIIYKYGKNRFQKKFIIQKFIFQIQSICKIHNFKNIMEKLYLTFNLTYKNIFNHIKDINLIYNNLDIIKYIYNHDPNKINLIKLIDNNFDVNIYQFCLEKNPELIKSIDFKKLINFEYIPLIKLLSKYHNKCNLLKMCLIDKFKIHGYIF